MKITEIVKTIELNDSGKSTLIILNGGDSMPFCVALSSNGFAINESSTTKDECFLNAKGIYIKNKKYKLVKTDKGIENFKRKADVIVSDSSSAGKVCEEASEREIVEYIREFSDEIFKIIKKLSGYDCETEKYKRFAFIVASIFIASIGDGKFIVEHEGTSTKTKFEM